MPTCMTVLLKYCQHVRMLLITATPLIHMTARQINHKEWLCSQEHWMQEQMSGVGLL